MTASKLFDRAGKDKKSSQFLTKKNGDEEKVDVLQPRGTLYIRYWEGRQEFRLFHYFSNEIKDCQTEFL